MYSKIQQDYGEREGNRLTNNLANILIIICTIIIIFGIIFTKLLVKIFDSGFEDEVLTLAKQFTKISLLGLYFAGLMCIYLVNTLD